MKKHIRNKKTIGAIVVAAAVLSVGSVGFASWVIAGEAQNKDIEAIGVDVGKVEAENIDFSPIVFDNCCEIGPNNDSAKTLVDNASNPTKAYIVFGPASGDTTGLIRTKNGTVSGDSITYDVTDIGHMTVQFKFTLASPYLFTSTSTRTALDLKTISITPTYPAFMSTLETEGYIKNPGPSGTTTFLFDSLDDNLGKTNVWTSAYTKSTGRDSCYDCTIGVPSTPAVAGDPISVEVTVKAKWAWGTKFNGIDPSTNDSDQSTVNKAIADLRNLGSEIGSAAAQDKQVSFKIEVNAPSLKLA